MLAKTVRQAFPRTQEFAFVLTGARSLSLSVADRSKVVGSVDEALKDVQDGTKILFGGFGPTGVPCKLIDGLVRKNVRNIWAISNDLDYEGEGLGKLITTGQVTMWCGSVLGENVEALQKYQDGDLDITLIPMFREFEGKRYIMEKAIRGEVCLIKGWKADTMGNVIFRKAARNFNSVMAMACSNTIIEVEEVVEAGMLDPDSVHLCGIYVEKVVKVKDYEHTIRFVKTQEGIRNAPSSPEAHIREYIAKRAALEFRNGMYVNLGFGMPLECADHIPRDMIVHLQSENGIMRVGPHPHIDQIDPDIINAGKETVTVLPGAAYFGSDIAFDMIRGNHLDITVLGGMQVSMYGDLANWSILGQRVFGMGGAMDLVSAPETKCIAVMRHNDKYGQPKIVEDCSAKMPLTGKNVIDIIITEKAVFHVNPHGLILEELGEGFTVEDIVRDTGCKFEVSQDLKPMGQIDA